MMGEALYLRELPVINLGLVAHVDAGKTTLTEQLLHLGGAIRDPGRVDEGTAHTDFLSVERQRGISVRSAAASLIWQGVKSNLIDTPGHVDFLSEVERALRVLDVAVLLISAVEGVQPQTRLLWKALSHLKLPTLLFINKTDRAGADIGRVMEEIRAQLTGRAFLLPDIEKERDALIERLCEDDDALTERYLNGEAISEEELYAQMARQLASLQFIPALAGAALRGQGVRELMDIICRIAPRAGGSAESPLSGVVYRVEHDAAHGRVAHVRLYQGAMRNRDMIYNATRDVSEKVFQIRSMQGTKSVDAGELFAGDIGAVYGMESASVGDALGNPAAVPEGYALATSFLRARVTPESPALYTQLMAALTKLSAEDPLLRATFGHEEAHIHITGKIQLEILQALLEERFSLRVTFGEPIVLYKETPAQVCEGFEAYTMPKPCWAVVRFLIEPLPIGSGVEYVEDISNELIHYRYRAQIRQTIPEALRQGPLGWEVTDIRITLIDGGDHPIHTHPLDFVLATPLAMMDGLVRGGTTLLEPMLRLTISAPEECAGRIIGDMVKMRGAFDSPEIHGDLFTLSARVPVATSLDYPVQLAAATSGRATLAMEFDGYQPCPQELGATSPYIGVDPRNRMKYILWRRGAVQ